MNRNTLAALSLTASLSLTLAACGSGGGTAQSPAPAASTPPAASGAPSGGVEDGVLTVGMECAYAPYNWTQMDDSNGAVPVSNVPGAYANGYDVMIAQRICDANGWELEVVSTAWDSLIPALQSGTIDVAIAGQSMTADRMAQVDMAGPYYYADIVCLTTAGSAYAAAQGIADLAGGLSAPDPRCPDPDRRGDRPRHGHAAPDRRGGLRLHRPAHRHRRRSKRL